MDEKKITELSQEEMEQVNGGGRVLMFRCTKCGKLKTDVLNGICAACRGAKPGSRRTLSINYDKAIQRQG